MEVDAQDRLETNQEIDGKLHSTFAVSLPWAVIESHRNSPLGPQPVAENGKSGVKEKRAGHCVQFHRPGCAMSLGLEAAAWPLAPGLLTGGRPKEQAGLIPGD